MSNNETDSSDTEVVNPATGNDEVAETLDAIEDAPVEIEAPPAEAADEAAPAAEPDQGPADAAAAEGEGAEAGAGAEGGGGGRLRGLLWPASRKRRVLTLLALVTPIAGGVTFFLLPAPETGGAQKVDPNDIPVENIQPDAAPSPEEVVTQAPRPDDQPLPGEQIGVRSLVERGELAMRNESWEEADRLLREAMRLVQSNDYVMRGRIFEALARVSRELGDASLARLFETRAREQLLEVFEPAQMIDAAEGKVAVGDYRAAQALYARFLLLSGSLEGDAVALRRRAELGLARALDAEWRATEEPGALDRLPEPTFHFGERR